MNLAAEFFKTEARFKRAAGANAGKVVTDERKEAEHGKAFKGQEDGAAGALLYSSEHIQVGLQGRAVDNERGRSHRGVIYGISFQDSGFRVQMIKHP